MAIVVLGHVFIDVKGFPEDLYIPKGRNAGSVQITHGGVGRNVAEDIANMELRPVFVSMVDDDEQGEAVIKKLRNHRVNTDYVLKTENGMGMWLAVFDSTGDIAASISRRPEMSELAKLIEEKGDEIFKDADSIVLEIDMDKEIIKSVLKFAKKYGKKVIAVVANMSIFAQRRDLIKSIDCFVCNKQEAGILFASDFEKLDAEQMCETLSGCVVDGQIPSMVVTMGAEGSVWAEMNGGRGVQKAQHVGVKDTTGAGDAFCAGVAAGLTYGKSLAEAVEIGTRLASSVIVTSENVCPRFMPRELGLDVEVEE